MENLECAEEQGLYYRKIAAVFLSLRGAPLMLSPGEFSVIAGWEKREIPLDAVLDGIQAYFEYVRSKGRSARGLRLRYCEPAVDRAFAQYRERRAGGRPSAEQAMTRPKKSVRALAEVEACLRGVDRSEAELISLLERAAAALRRPEPDEGALEALDESVDGCLRAKADPVRTRALKKEIAASLSPGTGIDPARVIDIRLAKEMRERLRIPYFSLFYY